MVFGKGKKHMLH